MAEQSITQLFRQLDPLFVQKYGAQWKRATPPATVTPSVGAGAASTALTQHAGLDWIEAHPTKDPAINRTRTYYSINFGIVGGAAVDESNNILAMLNAVGLAGGGTVVICAVDPADPIHIAKTISIYYSNVHVVFPPGQSITYEDKASLRIMGDYAQITRKVDGTAMKLHVDSTVVSNETVLELSATDTALMDAEANPALRIVRVGDKIVVRGQNDASGKSIEKDTSFVKALAKVGSYWQITCTDELDYTFQPTYPASEWPADLTTGTTIYVIEGSLLTVNSAVNDTSITVADGTVFTVGDLIEVGDNRNEYAMNSSAITGAGNPYKNPANLEQRQVVAIAGNVLTLDNALVRSTSTTYYAFAALMVPVVNSTIVGARISYVADGIRSANALQITYALDCHIYDCYVDGSGGRKGHGLRISYSYKCTAHRNRIENPKYSGSGEGYGITIYYATKILVDHNYVSGCRHNFLLQLATESIVSSNYSINDLISGIDLHGVRSKRCVIQNNHVTRSKLQDSDGSTKSGGIRIGNTSHSGGDDENLIQGNYISGYRGYNNTDGNGIDIFAASAGNIIRNNVIEHCYNGLRFGLNSKQITPVQFIDNTIVEGNVFRNCENRAVEIIAAPTYDNVNSNGKFSQITFINNISDGNNRHFEFTGVVTTLGITDVVCVGNQIINPTNVTTTYYGVSAQYVDGFVHVYDNNVSKAQRGIYLKGNGVCHVVGNKTANTVQNDPFTDGGGNTSVNYVDAMVSYAGGIVPTVVDVKGDLIAATAADTVARLAAGANDTILIADSAQTTGLRWATPTQLAAIVYAASGVIKADGTVPLSADWDAGLSRRIKARILQARDANGLGLYEDSGNLGLNISDNGDVTGSTGKYIAFRTLRALDANGLDLCDDSGTLGIFIKDGTAEIGFGTGSPGSGVRTTTDGAARVRQSGNTRYRMDANVSGASAKHTAYDDTGAAYIPYVIESSAFSVKPNGGASVLDATSTGVAVTGNHSVSGTHTRSGTGFRYFYDKNAITFGVSAIDILPNDTGRARGVMIYGFATNSGGGVGEIRQMVSSGLPSDTTIGTDVLRVTCTSGGKVSIVHYSHTGGSPQGTFSVSIDIYWAND
jgi:hypothetical protein